MIKLMGKKIIKILSKKKKSLSGPMVRNLCVPFTSHISDLPTLIR